MSTRKQIPVILFFLTLASVLLIALPAAALPPRPTPPTAAPAPPAGGFIVLTAVTNAPAPPQLWTRVQWQDPQGGWHEVDGWRGAFSPDLTVTWWVAPDDLGAGPFRWLVYAAEGSEEIAAVSDPFFLPPAPKQTTAVTITLP